MSNQVNVNTLRRDSKRFQFRSLALELLHAVFAKESHPSLDSFDDRGRWMCFRHRHQAHFAAWPASPGARFFHALLNRGQSLFERGHSAYLNGTTRTIFFAKESWAGIAPMIHCSRLITSGSRSTLS